jgi:hypothetical protein
MPFPGRRQAERGFQWCTVATRLDSSRSRALPLGALQ